MVVRCWEHRSLMRIAGCFSLKFRLPGLAVAGVLTAHCFAAPNSTSTSIFAPNSTPADEIFGLSMFVLAVTGVIFAIVFGLLLYAAIKFRKRGGGDSREPLQIYG